MDVPLFLEVRMHSNGGKYQKVLTVCLSLMMLLGCVSFNTAMKESGLEISQGETVFNRVGFRTYGEKVIYYTNRYVGGTFIPAGSECVIQDMSGDTIKFTFNGEQYALVEWIGDVSAENVKPFFEKFFSKNRSEIGLGSPLAAARRGHCLVLPMRLFHSGLPTAASSDSSRQTQ